MGLLLDVALLVVVGLHELLVVGLLVVVGLLIIRLQSSSVHSDEVSWTFLQDYQQISQTSFAAILTVKRNVPKKYWFDLKQNNFSYSYVCKILRNLLGRMVPTA